MKNFNLDNLDKKTPYKIPENFFEEMQDNVLEKIEKKQHKETKIFRLNYSVVTSLAAALALIFGFTFLWKTNQTDISKNSDTVSNNQPKTTVNQENNSNNSLENTDIATIQDVQKTIKTVEETNAVNTKTNSEKTDPVIANTDENYEQLLNSLTEDELTELTKNSDHDIYLELYN